MKRYYFDNAATSYPKPQTVITEMMKYFSEIGSSPGREDMSLELAGRIVFNTRNNIKNCLMHLQKKMWCYTKCYICP